MSIGSEEKKQNISNQYTNVKKKFELVRESAVSFYSIVFLLIVATILEFLFFKCLLELGSKNNEMLNCLNS